MDQKELFRIKVAVILKRNYQIPVDDWIDKMRKFDFMKYTPEEWVDWFIKNKEKQ